MATEVKAWRPASVKKEYVATDYQTMVADADTFNPGDVVLNASTGIKYEYQGGEQFTALGDERFVPQSFYWNGAGSEGVAVSATNATNTLAGSGLRIHGQGIADTDSGFVMGFGQPGSLATITTTNEADHLVAVGWGDNDEIWSAASNGPFEVEAVFAGASDLSGSRIFLGFVAADADALDPPATGSGTTITLVQDEFHGIIMDDGLTDDDGLFLVSNKADAAASMETTDANTDLNTTLVGLTPVRLKVRIEANGDLKAYVNGILKATKAAAVTTSDLLSPKFCVGALGAAVETAYLYEIGARSLN